MTYDYSGRPNYFLNHVAALKNVLLANHFKSRFFHMLNLNVMP